MPALDMPKTTNVVFVNPVADLDEGGGYTSAKLQPGGQKSSAKAQGGGSPTSKSAQDGSHHHRKASVDDFDSGDESDGAAQPFSPAVGDVTGEPMTTATNSFAVLRIKLESARVSMDNEEVDQREVKRQVALQYMRDNKVISPDGIFRKRWDAIQIFLLAYVAIAVPYRIGFTHDVVCNRELCEGWFVFDAMVDMYFIVVREPETTAKPSSSTTVTVAVVFAGHRHEFPHWVL